MTTLQQAAPDTCLLAPDFETIPELLICVPDDNPDAMTPAVNIGSNRVALGTAVHVSASQTQPAVIVVVFASLNGGRDLLRDI